MFTALARVQRALGCCRTLVCAFSQNWKKQCNLRAKQAQLGVKEQELIGAVDTRWCSTYDMVKRILPQQQALSAVLAEKRDSWHLMPTSEAVSTLEMLVKVLEPLSVLTDALSGEESVTGSAVRPILKHVLDTCKADHKDEPLVAEMKSTIVRDLANRYVSPVISTLLDKCCFFGPQI